MAAKAFSTAGNTQAEPWSATLSAYFVVGVSMALWIAYTRLQLRIDGEDAMRLLQVRDLLAGQSWFDLTQYRLGYAEGTVIPLSRLVDAPIVGLIWLFDILVDRDQAEFLAMIAWPGLLFGLAVACLHILCYRLGGAKGAVYGTILASILLVQTGKFHPGSFDHGNLQLVLVALSIVGFVMRRPVSRYAILGGVSAALSIAIGTEMAAQIATIFLAFAIVWALRGRAEKRFVAIFAISSTITLFFAFAASVPKHAYRGGYCDAFSIDIAIPALVGTVGLAVLVAFFSGLGCKARLLAVAGLAVAIPATAWISGSACFANPYSALDPLLQEKWLHRVTDTRPITEFSPRALGAFIGCFIGWLISIWFVCRDLRRDPWTLLSVLLAVSLAMTAYQGRNQSVMSMLSVLPTSIFAARMIEVKNANANIWAKVAAIALFLISIPAITGATAAMKAAAEEARKPGPMRTARQLPANGVACSSSAALKELAAMPAGIVAAPFDLGPHILLNTPHRVLSAPYYRNRIGLQAQLDISYGAPEGTRGRLHEAGVTYVIRCRNDRHFAENNPGLAPLLKRGRQADFLQPLQQGRSRPLSIYRVLR